MPYSGASHMANLLASERRTYEDIWSSVESYAAHSPGEHYLSLFLSLIDFKTGTVLDAGTGSGKGGVALAQAGFDVTLCDITDTGLTGEAKALPFHSACLWHDLSRIAHNRGQFGRSKFDYTYCTDVLEHIPPQFTMLAIDQLLRVTRQALFLTVSLVPDNYGVWVGTALHQTVQPFTWWRDSLRDMADVAHARDLLSNAVFLLRPR
jgi:2-polyprenyl-3-methyl-5-hydroxy-6-metoxy-1,4-benzoquinol methylase